MGLEGQHGERGYAMAALLVSLAVMSVLMTAVLPAWRHQAKREKEAELVFRGEQYVRAIRLWEMKNGPGSRPPTFDILVQQKYLRKKYKDPMTEDGEFQPLFAGVNTQAAGGRQTGPGGRQTGPGQVPQQIQPQPSSFGSQFGRGGILGVVSKSKDASIRIYRGGSHYNEWQFMFAGAQTTPGGRGGQQTPGGSGSQQLPGGSPGQRGIGPGGLAHGAASSRGAGTRAPRAQR